MPRPIAFIGAPSSVGAFAPGQEKGPQALREAGVLQALAAGGLEVSDRGDLPRRRWRPDREHRDAMNLGLVVQTVRDTADAVGSAIEQRELPLVVGGDCTVGIGTVAACVTRWEKTALLYFDLHPDLNIPGQTSAAALDWMGVAHMLSIEGAAEALAASGPRRPLLQPSDVVFFARGPEQTTDFESRTLEAIGSHSITIDEVARDPRQSARAAMQQLTRDHQAVALHFDLDVVDFLDAPLSENAGHNQGLALEVAMPAFEELAADERVRAITVTEFNPDHGEEDGSTARDLSDRLAGALGSALGRST